MYQKSESDITLLLLHHQSVITLAQARESWQAFVNAVMNIRIA